MTIYLPQTIKIHPLLLQKHQKKRYKARRTQNNG